MKIRVIDWSTIVFMILFAPFLSVVLYMVVSSSVAEVNNIICRPSKKSMAFLKN